MQIILPNQIVDNSKQSLREIAIVNSTNNYNTLHETLELLHFFEKIYEIIKERINLPVYLTRTFFAWGVIISILAFIKLFQRDNFYFQYSIDLLFLGVSLLLISVIVYFNKFLHLLNTREKQINDYVDKLRNIQMKIIQELKNNSCDRIRQEKVIKDINDDIQNLSI